MLYQHLATPVKNKCIHSLIWFRKRFHTPSVFVLMKIPWYRAATNYVRTETHQAQSLRYCKLEQRRIWLVIGLINEDRLEDPCVLCIYVLRIFSVTCSQIASCRYARQPMELPHKTNTLTSKAFFVTLYSIFSRVTAQR